LMWQLTDECQWVASPVSKSLPLSFITVTMS